jgi:hypothetical protein
MRAAAPKSSRPCSFKQMEIPALLFAALSLDATLADQEQEKHSQRAHLPEALKESATPRTQEAALKCLSTEKKKEIQGGLGSELLDHED